MRKPPLISTTWEEGRIWDLWMLVHFGAGLVAGLSNVLLQLSVRSLFAWAFGVLVLWEIGEFIAGIRESPENQVLDLVAGALGIGAAILLASALPRSLELTALAASALIVAAACFAGWRAYRRRGRK
jgi:hypothetical protein